MKGLTFSTPLFVAALACLISCGPSKEPATDSNSPREVSSEPVHQRNPGPMELPPTDLSEEDQVALIRKMAKETEDHLTSVYRTAKALPKSFESEDGPLFVPGLSSEHFETARTETQNIQSAFRAFNTKLQSASGELRDALVAAGVSPERATGAAMGFDRVFNTASLVETAERQVVLHEAYEMLLNSIESLEGRWQMFDDGVEVDPAVLPEIYKKYRAAVDALIAASG